MNADRLLSLVALQKEYARLYLFGGLCGIDDFKVHLSLNEFLSIKPRKSIRVEARHTEYCPIELSFEFHLVIFIAICTLSEIRNAFVLGTASQELLDDCEALAISRQEDQPDPLPTDPKVKAGTVLVNALLDSTKYRSK